MRVLVLGATGMLGHKMVQVLGERYEVWSTVRRKEPLGPRVLGGVDAEDFETLEHAIRAVNPDVVVNCIGVIKQDARAKDPIICLGVNALLPHLLGELCDLDGRRLVHVSTDCVFDGRKGSYLESDLTNAEDLYGRTKALGEVIASPHVTLRTSIIGRELGSSASLVEWILSQNGRRVKGFTKAIFSGITTLELSKVVRDVVLPLSELTGLYHVSADPIAKRDLVELVAQAYQLDLAIEPSDDLRIDRSLDSTRFRSATGYCPPNWPDMIAAMAADSASYPAPLRAIAA